jgi:HAE1 family hydrophobic/amphiphilic exporter-1
MGTAVIGGMLTASFIAIFIVPVSFYVVERLSHGKRQKTTLDLDGAKASPTGDG